MWKLNRPPPPKSTTSAGRHRFLKPQGRNDFQSSATIARVENILDTDWRNDNHRQHAVWLLLKHWQCDVRRGGTSRDFFLLLISHLNREDFQFLL